MSRSAVLEPSPFCYTNLKKKTSDEVRDIINEHVEKILDTPSCFTAGNKSQFTRCTCLRIFHDDVMLLESLLKVLDEFAMYESQQRKLYLQGVVSYGLLQQKELKRGKRTPLYRLTGVSSPDCLIATVCKNAVRNIFRIGNIAWKNLVQAVIVPSKRNLPHLTENKHGCKKCTQRVIDFLSELGRNEGEAYATRFVRFLTGWSIREEERGHVQLPSSFTKRKIYETYCFQNGWVARADAIGNYKKVVNYKEREHDDENGDMAEWPRGSTVHEVCSFSTFLNIWAKYLPYLSIRPPSMDTCLHCHIFRNQAKYKDRVQFIGISHGGDDESPDSGVVDSSDNSRISRLKKLMQHNEEKEEFRENLVLAAAEHVKAARAQKDLAQKKIELSKENDKVVTLVVDFCQNLDLPHVGQEQPGDTYYYSPIWIYCLGIVNSKTNQLYAYTYPESAAKKGANNTTSCLLHFLKTFILQQGQLLYNSPLSELNLIMDNCGGQNKNNVLLKCCAYFVESCWFEKVNVIFLIKGHTKNSCDRNFNCLKSKWHKENVYTYQQTLEVLGSADNVTVVDASDIHYDVEATMNKFYTNLASGSIVNNHIFKFNNKRRTKMELKSKTSNADATTQIQSIRCDNKQNTGTIYNAIRSLHVKYAYRQMKKLSPIGLKPIKQMDLYRKWRPILPQEYKDITCPLPPESVIRQFKKKIIETLDEQEEQEENIDESDVSDNNKDKESDSINNDRNSGTKTKATKRKKVQLRSSKPRKVKKKESRITEIVDDSEDELWSPGPQEFTPPDPINHPVPTNPPP